MHICNVGGCANLCSAVGLFLHARIYVMLQGMQTWERMHIFRSRRKILVAFSFDVSLLSVFRRASVYFSVSVFPCVVSVFGGILCSLCFCVSAFTVFSVFS